jgi:hypothetical protein
MTESAREIDITVVCPQPGMLNVLNRIKKWHLDDPLSTSNVRCVAKARDLAEGMLASRESPESSILVPIGYQEAEVKRLLNDEGLRGLETVIRPQRPIQGRELDDFPSASLLSDSRIVNVQDTLPALRKCLLRLAFKNKICIRELHSEDDFRQYFVLDGALLPRHHLELGPWAIPTRNRPVVDVGVKPPRIASTLKLERTFVPLEDGNRSAVQRCVDSGGYPGDTRADHGNTRSVF